MGDFCYGGHSAAPRKRFSQSGVIFDFPVFVELFHLGATPDSLIGLVLTRFRKLPHEAAPIISCEILLAFECFSPFPALSIYIEYFPNAYDPRTFLSVKTIDGLLTNPFYIYTTPLSTMLIYDLPAEILSQIFESLPNNDLLALPPQLLTKGLPPPPPQPDSTTSATTSPKPASCNSHAYQCTLTSPI